MSQQVLERFHRALLEEIQTQRPEYLTASFTVAEIYQNLVPYGSHRDRIGVEMNGDYEDALIRLLAGEGGYLILESEAALKDLQAELERSNPNTGLYRDFAAVDVRLNQAHLDLSAAALDDLPDLAGELDADAPVSMAALAPGLEAASATDLGIVPPGVDIFDSPPEEPDSGPPEGAAPVEAGPGEGVELEATQVEADLGEDRSILAGAAGAHARGSARQPLSPEFVDEPAEADTSAEAAEEPARSTHAAGAASPASAVGGVGSGDACRWCQEVLPARDNLKYCPFCGTDLRLVPCRSCGEEVEAGWRFCAACGSEVGG